MSLDETRRIVARKLEEMVKKTQPTQARVMAVNGDNVLINPDDEDTNIGSGGGREYVKNTGPYQLQQDDKITVQRGRSPLGKYVAGFHYNDTDGTNYPRLRADKMDAPGGTMTLSAGTTQLNIATGSASFKVSGTDYDITDIGAGGTTVKVSANDTTPDELDAKIIGGFGIQTNEENDGGNEDLDFSQSVNVRNMLINARFDNWDDPTYSAPIYWTPVGAIAWDNGGAVHGPYATSVAVSGTASTNSTVYQRVTDLDTLSLSWAQGQTIYFGAIIKTVDTANMCRIYIADGVGTTYSSYQSSTGSWEWLVISRSIDGSATKVEFGVEVKSQNEGGVNENAALVDSCVASLEPLDSYAFYAPHPQDGQPVVHYAEIYCADASSAQTIATGASYTKLTAFTTDGLSANCTADSSNDKITFVYPGVYRVSGTLSFSCDTNNVQWLIAPFLNGSEQTKLHTTDDVGTANDIVSVSFNGFVDVTTTGWDLDVRASHDNGGNVDITVSYANLTAEYIGAT